MMLGKRIITALVATPAAIYVFWQGSTVFALAMIFLAMAAWFEYMQMLRNKSIRMAPVTGGFFVLAMLFSSWLHGMENMALIVFSAMSVILSMTVLNYHNFAIQDAAYNLLGIFYVGVPFAHFIMLRLIPDMIGMKYFCHGDGGNLGLRYYGVLWRNPMGTT